MICIFGYIVHMNLYFIISRGLCTENINECPFKIVDQGIVFKVLNKLKTDVDKTTKFEQLSPQTINAQRNSPLC